MEKEGYMTAKHALEKENQSPKGQSLEVILPLNENHQSYTENSQDCEYKESSDKLLHKHLSSDAAYARSISNNEQENSEIHNLALDSKMDVESCSIKEDVEAASFSCFRWISNFACIIGCYALIDQLVNFYGLFGSILFQIFGVILYIVDVVTDIISGADLISGTEIDYTILGKEEYENYTKNLCNDLLKHSHPIWGSINMGFAWFPAIISITNLIFHWRFFDKNEVTIHWTKKVSAILFIAMFWPLIGLMLNLRQFAPIENMIARVLKACDIEEKAKSFKPYQMKYFEGCVEAPLQICLQAFILIAGQMPGEIQMISISASLISIILNQMMANGFGGELELTMYDLISVRAKCVLMIFTTVTFRCGSLVMMTTLLRWYSIFPIVWIWWMTYRTDQKLKSNSSFASIEFQKVTELKIILQNLLMLFGVLLVGAVLAPIEERYWMLETFYKVQKENHDLERKKRWIFDSITSFLCHVIILIIIIVLWETTSVLDKNLSICTCSIIRNNISIICVMIMTSGLFSCLISYLYYKY